MENFNELFEQAEQISDKRKAIFNKLIEKTVSEILPKFCEAMEGFDVSRCYFKTSNKVNNYQEKQTDESGDEFFVICVRSDKTFNDAQLNFYESRYFIPEDWKDQTFVNDTTGFKRSGIIEFVKLLNSRLADLNKKYASKNDEAESLL